MDMSYAHGTNINRGYVASKADNEQTAYINVLEYDVTSGSPRISMWVAPSGSNRQLTLAHTWTAPERVELDYIETVEAGDTHWICAELFYSGAVVMEGRWTP